MSEPDHHSIELEVAAGDVDVVTDRIWLCNPMAVGEVDTPHGVRFTVGFADRGSATAAMGHLAAWEPVLQSVAADDWVATWREGAVPQLAGPLCVRLPEHGPIDGRIDLVVEPGASFGFGHPSTLLALELLAEVDLAGTRVLDIGSGSGVLAIAAGRLGASDIEAVDVDPVAVAATADNAQRNDVAVSVRLGSVDATTDEPVDVVLANLTAGTQGTVLPALGGRLASHTTVILSGLLDGQEATVVDLVPGHAIVDARRLDGWIAVRLTASAITSPET